MRELATHDKHHALLFMPLRQAHIEFGFSGYCLRQRCTSDGRHQASPRPCGDVPHPRVGSLKPFCISLSCLLLLSRVAAPTRGVADSALGCCLLVGAVLLPEVHEDRAALRPPTSRQPGGHQALAPLLPVQDPLLLQVRSMTTATRIVLGVKQSGTQELISTHGLHAARSAR